MARLLTPLVVAVALASSSLRAEGDAKRGKAVFASQCAICHRAEKGAPPSIGPNLSGVIGRRAGSLRGYDYSATMRSAGFDWDEARLRSYVAGPQRYLPGVRMTYPGLKDAAKLDDLVAFLVQNR